MELAEETRTRSRRTWRDGALFPFSFFLPTFFSSCRRRKPPLPDSTESLLLTLKIVRLLISRPKQALFDAFLPLFLAFLSLFTLVEQQCSAQPSPPAPLLSPFTYSSPPTPAPFLFPSLDTSRLSQSPTNSNRTGLCAKLLREGSTFAAQSSSDRYRTTRGMSMKRGG